LGVKTTKNNPPRIDAAAEPKRRKVQSLFEALPFLWSGFSNQKISGTRFLSFQQFTAGRCLLHMFLLS
jgi:hypothetical protein